MDKQELQRLDYEKTLQYTSQLADIRFKLLALLPIATGAAIGLAEPGKYPLSGCVLGLLGFFVTVGIAFYDQRNSQIYGKQMLRARLLELNLGMPPVLTDDVAGGPIGGRPKDRLLLFGMVTIWHDRGLAFIYSAVLASWAYLLSASTMMLAEPTRGGWHIGVPLVVAAAIAGVCWTQLHRLDKSSPETVAMQAQIEAQSAALSAETQRDP